MHFTHNYSLSSDQIQSISCVMEVRKYGGLWVTIWLVSPFSNLGLDLGYAPSMPFIRSVDCCVIYVSYQNEKTRNELKRCISHNE